MLSASLEDPPEEASPRGSRQDSIFFFFLMWIILKVFIEFVTILLLSYVLVFGC